MAETTPRPPSPEPPRTGAAPAKRAASRIRIQVDPADLRRNREPLERLKYEARAGAPALVLSLLFHLAILVVLAMWVFSTGGEGGGLAEIIVGWVSPEEAKKANEARVRAPVQIAAVPLTPQATANQKPDSKPTPPQVPSSASEGQSPTVGKPPAVEKALTGRTDAKKESLLSMFGGTKKSEGAVSMGLGWLQRMQKSDGHWELHQGYDDAGRANLRTDTGATSLALLSFLGAGNTHKKGKYQDTVRKGLDWLRKHQKPDGDLHDWNELGRQTAFYAHAQGTIVLLEAYALSEDTALLEPARKALQFISDSQNELGGWKYQPRAEGDLSVTGWQVMALQSARMAGLEVSEEVLARAMSFLDSVGVQDSSRYKYVPNDPDSRFSPALTAEGLLCRQYLGWPKNHPALESGVQYLLQPENLPTWAEGRRNVYHWYYATQVMHHMEGEAWKTWNTALRDVIVSNQVRAGKMAGSWHPTKPRGADHEYAEAAGRLYLTCLCILTLEVYYRHLPIYRQDVETTAERPAE